MKLDWIEFDIPVVVETPLTIGSGRLLKGDKEDIGGVAAVHLGVDGKPCIPATSLKGALRAAAKDEMLRKDMFGEISVASDKGVSGRLLFRAALWSATGANPRNETRTADKAATAAATFDRPATAIDRETGAVASGKLFTQRAVKRGAAFALRGRLLGAYGATDWKAALAADIKAIAAALSPLFNGLALGRGGRLGYGRVKADMEHAAFKLHRCDPTTGYGVPDDVSAQVKSALVAVAGEVEFEHEFLMKLTGLSPFIIVDPTPDFDADGREIIHPMISADGKPILWPSSLLGVLRMRAAWMAEIDRLRRFEAKQDPRFVPRDRAVEHPADDRFLEHIFGSGPRAVLSGRDLGRLSSVERLFGVPGWRGVLVVASLECACAGAVRRMTQVAIDRLTGGSRDGALFTTEAFEGTQFTVRLAVSPGGRAIPKVLRDQDRKFLSEFCTQIAGEGLMLGHSAARGFGWFDAKITETAA